MRAFIPTLACLGAFASQAAAVFNAASNTNVAIYWGQGAYQKPLSAVCANPDIDIVIIAFLDHFPDQSPGNYPGTNFGNACGPELYSVNGTTTDLLSDCPNIGPDITACQQANKKVFLSIGGGYPVDYYIKNTATAQYFADFVWGAFGPVTAAWTAAQGPRPFGNAIIDGFDFDIESNYYGSYPSDANGNPVTDYQSRGYADMIARLRTNYLKDTSKTYYISGAPQCPTPDTHLSDAITNAWFDFVFVQFYNTAGCSARDGINHLKGTSANDISMKSWTGTAYNGYPAVVPMNPNVKIYVGLPASLAAAAVQSATNPFYLTVPEVNTLIPQFMTNPKMGGIMLWEATYSQNNTICNKEYASWMKSVLTNSAAGTKIDLSCMAPPAPISTSGSCGGTGGMTCAGSTFGNCCSANGWCGSAAAYCGQGCQSAFGNCTSTSSTSSTTSTATSSTATSTSSGTATTTGTSTSTSSGTPTGTTTPSKPVSNDGSCAGTKGFSCLGSAFGSCCSQSGWCGSAAAYCGAGCQAGFGSCTGTGTGTTTTAAGGTTSTAKPVSNDASCGGAKGFTCAGSGFGNCCSKSGWCGASAAYCGAGCQTGFGTGCT